MPEESVVQVAERWQEGDAEVFVVVRVISGVVRIGQRVVGSSSTVLRIDTRAHTFDSADGGMVVRLVFSEPFEGCRADELLRIEARE